MLERAVDRTAEVIKEPARREAAVDRETRDMPEAIGDGSRVGPLEWVGSGAVSEVAVDEAGGGGSSSVGGNPIVDMPCLRLGCSLSGCPFGGIPRPGPTRISDISRSTNSR